MKIIIALLGIIRYTEVAAQIDEQGNRQHKRGNEKMRFIFTEKSFYPEEGGSLSGELQAWQEEFRKDKEYAWYLLGLKGCPPGCGLP